MRELALNNCRIDSRYDVRRRLGSGSYAEIFIAVDNLASAQSPHSQVVVKALNVFMQDDLDADLERTLVENFQNEAIALDRVRHPNVLSRLGHGTARDLQGAIFHYLVLEYLSGGDLHQSGVKKKLPIDQVLRYLEQICAGLGHAHRRGVIHRDIKPQNLLLTADSSTVKIADFGVARFSIADSPITRVGTNVYAPPEHSPLYGEDDVEVSFKGSVTPASDIYSLAKTVYALVSGESPRPFANKPIDVLPSNCCDQTWSSELLRVLNRSTQNDPSKRPQSAEEFWYELERVRSIVLDEETGTLVRGREAAPKPHVARGYSPIAPDLPNFEPTGASRKAPLVDPSLRHIPLSSQVAESAPMSPYARMGKLSKKGASPNRISRRSLVVALAAIFVLGGLLIGAGGFFQDSRIWAGLRGAVLSKTAIANTDIFLRSGPDADSDKIGLVTRNSKVRIVDSQNNWFQVDIVEQGRSRTSTEPQATRGWLNGKYLAMSN